MRYLGAGDCRFHLTARLDLQFLFDVDHDGDGSLSGTVAADIFGWFRFDLDAEEVSTDDELLDVSFAGSPFDRPWMAPSQQTVSAWALIVHTRVEQRGGQSSVTPLVASVAGFFCGD